MAEKPSPSGRSQSFGGPPLGQRFASPVASLVKFRFGPPHCVHGTAAFSGVTGSTGPAIAAASSASRLALASATRVAISTFRLARSLADIAAYDSFNLLS